MGAGLRLKIHSWEENGSGIMKKAFEGQRNRVPRDETNEASRSLPVCLRDLSSTLVCRCLVNAE